MKLKRPRTIRRTMETNSWTSTRRWKVTENPAARRASREWVPMVSLTMFLVQPLADLQEQAPERPSRCPRKGRPPRASCLGPSKTPIRRPRLDRGRRRQKTAAYPELRTPGSDQRPEPEPEPEPNRTKRHLATPTPQASSYRSHSPTARSQASRWHCRPRCQRVSKTEWDPSPAQEHSYTHSRTRVNGSSRTTCIRRIDPGTHNST